MRTIKMWWWDYQRRQEYKRMTKDTRPKRSYSSYRWAISRDGDYHLPECPNCHTMQLWFDEETRKYICSKCQAEIMVYLEDGVVRVEDHRDENPEFPTLMVQDDAGQWHMGITNDAPWWWRRRRVYRDLHHGKDAHQHQYYVMTPLPKQHIGECQPEAAS